MSDSNVVFVSDNKWSWEDFARHVIKKIEQKNFSMLNVEEVVQKYKNWEQKLPRVEPFYAVKCNYNRVLLETLVALGTGFDCASKKELKMMLEIGADPNKIVFAHTAKPEDHLDYARENKVDLLTFDGEFELHKIKYYHPNAKLLLRIKSEAKIAVNLLGNKFGCCPQSEAASLLLIAKQLNLNVVGISFHVGSMCGEPQAYERAIRESYRLFNVGNKLGHNMNLLDIGGGFPGDVGSNIDEIAFEINQSLDKYFPEGCGVKIIAEPGRYFTASAFTLACRVHSARKVYENGKKKIMYFADDGLYGSFAGITSRRLIIDPKPLDTNNESLIECSLWGPTCDGIDIIADNIMLPKLALPSWLLFHSFGAYTFTTTTNFNGFGEPQAYAFADQNTWNELQNMAHFESGNRLIRINTPKEIPSPLKESGPNLTCLYLSPVSLNKNISTPQKTKMRNLQTCSPLSKMLSSPRIKTNV